MSLHYKKGKWYAAVYMGKANGKSMYEWSDGYELEEDAKLAELKMKQEAIERGHKPVDKASLGYVAGIWLETKRMTVSGRTHESYKECYDRYIKREFGDKQIKDIEPIDINSFMVSLKLEPGSIAKVMTTLKQIFDFAVTLGYIKTNPCTGIKKPNIRKKKRKTWGPQQIKRFLGLSDTKNATCYTAYLILFSTGMRPGEVCGLDWTEFDDEGFNPTKGIDKNGNITELKNDKAKEKIFLSPELIMHLKKLKVIQMNIWKQQHPFEPFPENTYINCFTDDWRPMTPDYLALAFKRILKRNNIEPIRLYEAARHSFGTNLMKEGVNPKLVADLMRHTTVKTTLDNYSHPDDEMYKNTIAMYNKKFV